MKCCDVKTHGMSCCCACVCSRRRACHLLSASSWRRCPGNAGRRTLRTLKSWTSRNTKKKQSLISLEPDWLDIIGVSTCISGFPSGQPNCSPKWKDIEFVIAPSWGRLCLRHVGSRVAHDSSLSIDSNSGELCAMGSAASATHVTTVGGYPQPAEKRNLLQIIPKNTCGVAGKISTGGVLNIGVLWMFPATNWGFQRLQMKASPVFVDAKIVR